MPCSTIVAALPLAIWIYLVFARGGFWWVRKALAPAGSATASVTAVIPARNEAEVISRAVSTLLQQPNVSVIVVDDASTDATSEMARAAAAAANASSRLTVIPSAPLPSEWTGKLWAVQQGIDYAGRGQPDFLLLTDADVEHGPEAVSNLVAIANSGYDLVSFMVKLHCRSYAEKLLIPAFVYFFFKLYPPEWIQNPGHSMAGAAGGCMLLRPAALQDAGGISAIRNQIIDDCALARAVKQSGGRVWLGLTACSHSIRPYGSFGEIGRMISRTAFNQLRHSKLLLMGTLVGLLLTYVSPIALLACGDRTRVAVAAVACAMMIGSYLPMVRFYRLNPLWALSLPMAAIFYMGATVVSAIQYWSGLGGQWKGRAQDFRAAERK